MAARLSNQFLLRPGHKRGVSIEGNHNQSRYVINDFAIDWILFCSPFPFNPSVSFLLVMSETLSPLLAATTIHITTPVSALSSRREHHLKYLHLEFEIRKSDWHLG